jgi:hypothetical protein
VPEKGEDDEMWPPIHVKGETLSKFDLTSPDFTENGRFSLPLEQRTTVKWFPGLTMYESLGKAARLGMENVIGLLLLAGNEVRFLDRNVSLSKLMSNMKVT